MAVPIQSELFATETSVGFGLASFVFAMAPQLVTDGISSATLQVTLPHNALVQQFDVAIQARTASAITVQNVAQVRANPSASGQGLSITLDFGTLRTVSAVQVPSSLTIVKVTPWIGTGFASTPVYPASGGGIPGPNSSATTAILPSEIRTERLLVEANGDTSISVSDLSAQMAVVLPEAPSGLSLSINNGAPVFTYPGPAQVGPDSTLSDQAWSSDGKRIVHLAAALAALTGDPTKSDSLTFNIVLTSQVPGILGISQLDSGQSVLYVRRVVFGSQTDHDVVFSEEGEQDLPLDTFGPGVTADPAAAIQNLAFTAAATLPPERVLPPVGPDDAGLADLVLNPNLSFMVQLPSGTGLAELTAIRLPLLAGAGGAEARMVMWQSKPGGSAEPDTALPQASDPVKLAEAAQEAWTTFPFKQAVALDPSLSYWAALVLARGQIVWPLGTSGGALRSGPPAGPWLPLPDPFVTGNSPLVQCRGRIRVVGHARKDAPLAPILWSVGADPAVPLTPTQKGLDQSLGLTSSPLLQGAVLHLVSRVAGTVTIRNLDVVST